MSYPAQAEGLGKYERQDNQLEPTYNSSVPIQDVALKTYREHREGWQESGRDIRADGTI